MHFELDGNKYQISLNYYEAIKVLPSKFGIHLNKIFTDGDAAAQTMQTLALDDELCLKLAWYYVEPTASAMDEDDFYRAMSGKDLERFRDAFWQEVVNFSGPLKKNLLMEMWSQFKRDLKKAELATENSNASLSDSNPEE